MLRKHFRHLEHSSDKASLVPTEIFTQSQKINHLYKLNLHSPKFFVTKTALFI